MAVKRPTYQEYDEYTYDYETSNASFIALASILYRKGIKNYNFFLKIYDEDLIGVDPHDPSLSLEMKAKIIIECQRNFWYFAREVMMIPETGGAIRFKLHRGNLAAAWALCNNIPTYLVLPRQHGKTWLVLTFALWVFNFSSNYTNMLFMNKQLGDSRLNLSRLKDAREELPDYLQMKSGVNEKGEMKEIRSNVDSATNGLKNRINVKASARNPIAADELGRGMTVAWVWIDEVAFLQFNRIIYAAMIPAWRKAADSAMKKHRPVARILTTTPGDLAVDHGKFAWEIRDSAAWFDESLYDKDSDDVVTWMEKNSKNGYLYIEFMYYQLDHPDPDKWFELQCEDLLYDWPKIRREVLIQWNNASSNSPFDEEDLKDLRYDMIKPIEDKCITINKYYKLNVYRPLEPGDKYLINVDPAKGRGEKADRTAIVVTNAKTHMIHAIFKSNTIQYKETFRFLYTLVYKYIPNSVLIVENNIDTLIEYIKNSTMRHLLYYEFSKDTIKEKRKKGVLQPPNKSNIVYGINTGSSNRPKYFDILFEYVRKYKEYINCEEMVEEIECLEYKTAQRIEATSGTHDDVILAYLLGEYVMREGNNKARFGLFYADAFGTEYKKIDERVFNNTDYNNRTNNSVTYNIPFFNSLFAKPESIEDIDRRWKKQLKNAQYNDLEEYNNGVVKYETNIFTGEKDVSGMSMIDAGAFDELNDFDPYRNMDSEDRYGSQELDFMQDLDTSNFW